MERLDAWWKETYTLAVRDCHQFHARLPELKREALESTAGEPADVAAARRAILVLCEGIVHWAAVENDAAELALKRALADFETLRPRAATPGLPTFLHRMFGACRTYLGHVAHNRGDQAEALRAYLHVRDLALLGGFAVMRYQALCNIGMIYAEAGLWEEHLVHAREARAAAQGGNLDVSLSQLEVTVAHTYRKLRDFASARRTLEGAIVVFQRHAWKGEELDATIRLAMLDLDEGAASAAIQRLRGCAPLARDVDRPHFEAARLTELARAHLTTGDTTAALELLTEQLPPYADAMGAIERADAMLVRARVRLARREFDAAWQDGREALDQLARTGLPHELEVDAHGLLADIARAQENWPAACAAERARHEVYVRHFNQQTDVRRGLLMVQHQVEIARATAERERVERQRLEEVLAEVGARLAEATAKPVARSAEEITAAELRPLGLTVRESEVLLWVVRGKTNDEIAIILGCGAETVKTHLKRVYQQLDVTNRAAAAAAALRPVPTTVSTAVNRK